MVKAVDLDGNGTIEAEEFKEVFDGVAQAQEGADTAEAPKAEPAPAPAPAAAPAAEEPEEEAPAKKETKDGGDSTESLLQQNAQPMKVSYVEIERQGLGTF